MQIILEENEIMDALNAYCAKQIKVPEGKRIKVDFTVGRGANATRATIEFEDIIQASTTEAGTVTTLEKKTKKPEEEVNEVIENAAKEKPISPVKKDPEPPVNPMATQQEKKESAPTEEPAGSAETSSAKTDSLFNF